MSQPATDSKSEYEEDGFDEERSPLKKTEVKQVLLEPPSSALAESNAITDEASSSSKFVAAASDTKTNEDGKSEGTRSRATSATDVDLSSTSLRTTVEASQGPSQPASGIAVGNTSGVTDLSIAFIPEPVDSAPEQTAGGSSLAANAPSTSGAGHGPAAVQQPPFAETMSASRLSMSMLLESSTSMPSGPMPSVSSLCAQLFAQYAAPRPMSSKGSAAADAASLQRLYPGWNEDTARTGLLGLSYRQLMRRLCIGRPEASANKLEQLARAFVHVASGGTSDDFTPLDPSRDRRPEGVTTVASIGEDSVWAVLQCVGRAVGLSRDELAAKRFAAMIRQDAEDQPMLRKATATALFMKPAPVSHGASLLEFLACFGHVAEEVVSGTSVRSVASLLRLYAPQEATLAALACAHTIVDEALEHSKKPGKWQVMGSSEPVQVRLAKLTHGLDLLRVCGFDDVQLPDGRLLFLLDGAHDLQGRPNVLALPGPVLDRLVASRGDLESEIEVMEGAPTVGRSFRELQASAVHVDGAGRAAWLGKLLLAGRLLLKYTSNILTNPGEARNWRVNPANQVFSERLRSLGEPVAAKLMAVIGFSLQGEFFVLKGTRAYDPAAAIVPTFPGTADRGPAAPLFAFPALPDEVLSFLLKRRGGVEERLFALERELTAMGVAPTEEPLMAATASAQATAASLHGGASSADQPPVKSAVPPAPGKGAVPTAAAVSLDPLMTRNPNLSEAALVIPILMRAALLPPLECATGSAVKKPAAKGASASAGGSTSATVAVTDAKYAIQLTQLSFLKKIYNRLDTRGTGGISVTDLRAAFAAEARPARERTDEALAAWISSRDLNGDGAVSWPEFAASFASLFLPPLSGAIKQDESNMAAKGVHAAKDTGKPGGPTPAEAAAAAADLLTARTALAAELTVLMTTCEAQVQAVMKTGMTAGQAIDTTTGSLLLLPWASAILDILSGLGLLLLFNDRYAVRTLLAGWTAHVTALVSEPTNAALWAFRVTTQHEITAGASSAVSMTSSSAFRESGMFASISTDAARKADMTLAWDVARLPGMQLVLRGFGYTPEFDTKSGKRGGVPVSYRLCGSHSTSWGRLPDGELPVLSACAQVLARHAVMFEGLEAADPVVVMLGVASVACGGQLVDMLRKLAAMTPLPAPSAHGGSVTGKAAPAGKTPAKGAPGKASPSAGGEHGAHATGNPAMDSLLDSHTAGEWEGGLDTLHKYLANVSRSPNDMSFRRINTNNAAFQHKLSNLSCPRPLSGYDPDARSEGVPHVWHGHRTLSAIGFRETPDGSLVLPPTASLPALQTRVLELDAALPLLRAAHHLTKVKRETAAALLTVAPPKVPSTSSSTGGANLAGHVTDVKPLALLPPQLPTSLLSTLLDPRTALSRRYSESNALRGSESLAHLDSALDVSAISAATAPGMISPAGMLRSTLRPTYAAPPHQVLSAGQLTPDRPGPTGASESKSAPATPGLATGRARTELDPSLDKASALMALGPTRAGEAMQKMLDDTDRVKADARARVSELESELAELRAQVKTTQVAELMPLVKQSIGALEKGSQSRQSAVAAAAGLGMKVADNEHKSGVGAVRAASPGKAKSPGKSGKKGSATEKVKLTKNPVVIHSSMRLGSPSHVGESEFFVKAKVDEMAGEMDPEVAERIASGEVFVPDQCQIKAGEYVMIGTDVNADLGFVRKVVPAAECDRGADEYMIVLDRPSTLGHDEVAFVTRQHTTDADRAKFYKNEITMWLQQEVLPALVSDCAEAGETAIRLRGEEARYMHRTATKRVPVGLQLYGDVAEALLPVSHVKRATCAPFDAHAGMLFSLGSSLGMVHTGAPPGSRSLIGLAPITGYAAVGSMTASAELFGHVFDLLDYGANGALTLTSLMDRMRNDGTAWAAVCSDAALPLCAVDSSELDVMLPTAHQVWQRLVLHVSRLEQSLEDTEPGTGDAPPVVYVTRHAFSAMFRVLHPLDLIVAQAGAQPGEGGMQAHTGRVLETAHWNDSRAFLNSIHVVEFWGTVWDTARAAVPLLSEEQLGDVALAFVSAHAAEHGYSDGTWCAMTPNNPLQMDFRYPPPQSCITFRAVREVCFAIDGDAPREDELRAYARTLHKSALAARMREVRRLRGEAVSEEGGDEEDGPSEDADEEEEEEDADGNRAPKLARLPPEPFPGLCLDDILHVRAARDARLLLHATGPAASDVLAKGQKADVLAAERRRCFPSPGLARLPHVLRLLRSAFVDVRRSLVLNITHAVEGRQGQGTLPLPGAVPFVRLGLSEQDVDKRVGSIAASDMLSCLARTDEGRRLLVFPLALPGGTGVRAGRGSHFVTVQSLVEHLARGSSTGHISWAQISVGILSCGRSVSVSSGEGAGASPAAAIPLPGLTAACMAQQSLVPIPAPAQITVLDVTPDPVANTLCVCTSDGSLVGYDGDTLNRKWAVRALPPNAAKALEWLKSARAPHLHPLAVSSARQDSSCAMDRSTFSSVGTEGTSLVMVNLTLAAFAQRLCAAEDATRAVTLQDAGDLHGNGLRQLTWRSNTGSAGHLVAQVQPRIVLDTELVSFGADPDSGDPVQHIVRIAAHTPMMLLECLYLHDSHLVIATALPNTDAAVAACAHAQTADWPRLMAFDALTGACVGDLGTSSCTLTSGAHLAYVSSARHVLAADIVPIFGGHDGQAIIATSPVLKVWDISGLCAVSARQRAAFLHAAVSPLGATAASSAMQHTVGALHNNNESVAAGNTSYAAAPTDGAEDFVPHVITVPSAAVLDIMCQFPAPTEKRGQTGRSSFGAGPPIVSLVLLPNSGMLAVAQGDGSLSLWDAAHVRERLHYPPTSTVGEEDYAAGYEQASIAAMEGSDDPRFTRVPKGMHVTTSLKLSAFYKAAGVLRTAIGQDQADGVGRLARHLQPHATSAMKPASVQVGLAVLAGGPGGMLRMSRLPCRVRSSLSQASQVADIAGALVAALLSTVAKADPDAEADRADAAAEASGKAQAARPSSTGGHATASATQGVYAGYVYILEDGTSYVVDSPATTAASSRAFPTDALGRLFDQRMVELGDEVYLTAAAASDLSPDAFATLKKVLLQRHRVQRVFYTVSRGVPLGALLPALTKTIQLSPAGMRVSGGVSSVSVPVAAAPFATIIMQLAAMHDAVLGTVGAAVNCAPGITDLCTPRSDIDYQDGCTPDSPFKAAAVGTGYPLLVCPFYTPGDGAQAVMMMRRLESPPAAPFNAQEAGALGRYWTSGLVVSVTASGRAGTRGDVEKMVHVALDHEDRMVQAFLPEVQLLGNGAGCLTPVGPNGLSSGEDKELGPGDRVLLCARTALTDATLGAVVPVQLAEDVRIVFPPSVLSEPSQPGLDVLAVHIDYSYEPQEVGPGSSGAEEGDGPARASLVRRHLLLWAVGRAEASVSVQAYDDDLPDHVLEAMDGAFERHAHGALLRAQGFYTMARAVGQRRAAIRNAIIVARASDLYLAANSGASGSRMTGAALFKGISAMALSQVDTVSPAIRQAVLYIWSMRRVLSEAEAAQSGAALTPDLARLGDILPLLAAAAWHFPAFRYALRHLVSLGEKSVEHGDSGIYGRAAGAMSTYKKFIMTECGGRGGEEEGSDEGEMHVTLQHTLDAATSVMRETYTLDTLLGLLEYLRDAGGASGTFEGAPIEHMVQSLVRRHALPWDPPALLALGIADGVTVDAMSDSGVVATPLEAYQPAEVAFLLTNAPSVAVISAPALEALARAFADPAAAMLTTLAVIMHVSDRQHLRAALPELALLDTQGDPLILSSRELDEMFDGIFSVERLGGAMARLAADSEGTTLTQLSAHSKNVRLACNMLADNVLPSEAESVKTALSHVQPRQKKRGSQKIATGAASVQERSAEARKAAIVDLHDRVYVLLADAPVSVTSTGVDASWNCEYEAAAGAFSDLCIGAAEEGVNLQASNVAAAIAAAEHRSILSLLQLLSHGALEALVHAAIIHTCGALRVPTVPREAARAPAAKLLQALARIFNLFLDDSGNAARRLASHLPRLIRALVYTCIGRLDIIPDDIPPDTSKTPPVLHPIDTRLISPSYIAALHPVSLPLIQRLFGVDGRGNPASGAICRYVGACTSASCLARGPTLVEDGKLKSASALLPVAASPFLAPYDAFFSGFARAASADDVACKTSTGGGARRVIAWTFEESVEQFARRHKPAAPITGNVAADLSAMANFHAVRASKEQSGLAAETAAREEASEMDTIMKLAGSGTPHMLSPFSAFRRGQSYWRQFGPMLTALERMHAGVPDAIADVTTPDVQGGEAVAIHARLMDRVAARRVAMSRFKLVLRPPTSMTRGTALAGEEDGEPAAQSGSDTVESEVDDIDRSLLSTDFQVPDFVVALMHDADPEVRTLSFRAVRALCMAVASPLMDAEGDAMNELAADSRGMASFAARARSRRWTDLLYRFSAMDCTVAAVRRMTAFAAWTAKGGPSPGGPPESHEVVALGVDILAAQAAARTAQASIWRVGGVLGCLTRLSQAGLPRPDTKKTGLDGGPKAKSKGAPGGRSIMPGGRMSQAVGGVLPHRTTADALLRAVCTDHAAETLLGVVRFDHAARTWAAEHGVELHDDSTGTWDAVSTFLGETLEALHACNGVDKLAAAAAAPESERQGSLDEHTAHVVARLFSMLTAQLASVKRALMLELESVTKGACTRVSDVTEAISALWTLYNAAWDTCMCTHADHTARGPAQAFLHALLTFLVYGAKRGLVTASLLLGCPIHEELSAGTWVGMSALVRTAGSALTVHVYEPDAARLVQSRATYVLADLMTRALDLLSTPSSPNTSDVMGHRRAAVERRFGVTLLAQAADADPMTAYLSGLAAHIRLVKESAAVKALRTHAVHCGGQSMALGIHGRSLLWTACVRAALLQSPPQSKTDVAGAAASGASSSSSVPMSGLGRVSGVDSAVLTALARAYGERIMSTHAIRRLLGDALPVLVLLDGSSALPPALSPFGSTYPVRMEGVAALWTLSTLMLQTGARVDVQTKAGQMEEGRGDGSGADPRDVDAGTTLLNATLRGTEDGPAGMVPHQHSAGDEAAASLAATSRLLSDLQEHIGKLIAAEGTLSAERSRLWACKDVSLSPSVCIVMQAILQAVPRDEGVRRVLLEMGMPTPAVDWYRALRRLFAASASPDVAISVSSAKRKYAEAEKAGVAAWVVWRSGRFNQAPGKGESEAGRPLAGRRGASGAPPPVPAVHAVAALLGLTGARLGTTGGDGTGHRGVTKGSLLNVSGAGQEGAVGPQAAPTPVDASVNRHGRAAPTPTPAHVRKAGSSAGSLPAPAQARGGGGVEILATAGRRMHGGGAGAPAAIPSADTDKGRKRTVAATSAVLSALGDAVIEVKEAFDAHAGGWGKKGAKALRVVGGGGLPASLQALGLPWSADMLERLGVEGVIDGATSPAPAPLSFAAFLRVVGRLCAIHGFQTPPGCARVEVGGGAGAVSMVGRGRGTPSAPPHDGPLFTAAIAVKLILPSLPQPSDLLAALFDRYATAKMVLVPDGPAGGGGSGTTGLRQCVVRGIPFTAWPAVLTASGLSPAPSESREVWRFIGKALAEVVDIAGLCKGWSALSGWRFLTASELLVEGSDMLHVATEVGEEGDAASDISGDEEGEGGGASPLSPSAPAASPDRTQLRMRSLD